MSTGHRQVINGRARQRRSADDPDRADRTL